MIDPTAPSNSPVYTAWSNMLYRCENPKASGYAHYGGRGITVCERWHIFAHFLADMGERPDGMSLDRWPNNDGNYEPGNCRWATKSQQARNKRNSLPPGSSSRKAGAVLVLMTLDEREQMREAAKRAGLGVSPWFRMLAMREINSNGESKP